MVTSFDNFVRIASLCACMGFRLGTLHGYFCSKTFGQL